MEVISKINDVQIRISEWKKQGKVIGLVPTMGALHIGHESLIKKAKSQCDKVVVSVFVNPIQFGPNEDFDKYPRQLEKDMEICARNHVDFIFAPDKNEMYPEYEHLTLVVPPDYYKNKLCGKSRIGHFDGVATVVLKLFNIIQPDKAFFGLKDAQQFIIIKKICRDLNVPVEIIGCPIIRDQDGLACSSRNKYLSSESRQKALSLSKLLNRIQQLYNAGDKSSDKVFKTALAELDPDIRLDYLDAYNAESFEYADILTPNTLVAIAAYVDGVRLIDNILI